MRRREGREEEEEENKGRKEEKEEMSPPPLSSIRIRHWLEPFACSGDCPFIPQNQYPLQHTDTQATVFPRGIDVGIDLVFPRRAQLLMATFEKFKLLGFRRFFRMTIW
jgi:hypothetical protein